MVKFVCRNCGNQQLQDSNGTIVKSLAAIDVKGQYFCKECGAELAKDQMIELIKAIASETALVSDLRRQARNAKKSGDHENAINLYQQLQLQKTDDWEAAFYSVYCNCYNAVGAVENACNALKMCLDDVFSKIDNLQGEEKRNAVSFVMSDACLFALHMFDSAVKQHSALDSSVMTKNNGVLKNQLISALNIAIACSSKIMNRYGDEERLAELVESPAKCALQMQSRQSYVALTIESDTCKTLLEWIGRFDPKYVEQYKAKQNRAMISGTIFLIVSGAIFYAIGHFTEGTFSDWFCIPMSIFCGAWAVLRIIVQLINKLLNKK